MKYLGSIRLQINDELKKKNWNRKTLAKKANIDEATLSNLLSEKNRFNETHLIKISKALNIPVYKLFVDGDMISKEQAFKEKEYISTFKKENKYKLVPLVVNDKEGTSINLISDKIIGYKAFEKVFVENMHNPFCFQIKDNYMFPTLHKNDIVLVDRNPEIIKESSHSNLYVYTNTKEEANRKGKKKEENTYMFFVRRTIYNSGKKNFELIPDNSDYTTIYLSKPEAIGTIAWIGRDLNRADD